MIGNSPHPTIVSGVFATEVVAGVPTLVFDWMKLGQFNTALRFVFINTGGSDLIVTPEAAYLETGPAEMGPFAPKQFTVPAGYAYGDPYGVDEMRPYWRVWVNGNTTYKWAVFALQRRG